jgi:hypothetical protein
VLSTFHFVKLFFLKKNESYHLTISSLFIINARFALMKFMHVDNRLTLQRIMFNSEREVFFCYSYRRDGLILFD